MKKCENCFEQNTDGATNCVICGEPMAMGIVAQVEAILDSTAEALQTPEPPKAEEAPLEGPQVIEVPMPAPEPVLPAPEPALPAPEPVLPPPETVLPPPETVLPAPEPVLVAPEPVLPAPEPVPVKAVLEIYHDTEAKIVYAFDVVNDITLIGREDPQRDVFPDLDLGKLENQGISAKSVSREHMRLLRQGNKFFLFIFRGSTGTQVNKEIIPEKQYNKKIEIQLGDRIILGGKVRMKLVAKN